MRRIITLSIAAIVAAVISGGNLAAAGAAPARAKPPGPHAITKIVPRSARSGGTVRVAGGKATLPAHGGPPVVLKPSAYKALRAAMRKPRSAPAGSPRNKPAHGRLVRLIRPWPRLLERHPMGCPGWREASQELAPPACAAQAGRACQRQASVPGESLHLYAGGLAHLGVLKPLPERAIGGPEHGQPERCRGSRPGVRGQQRQL